MPVTPSTALIVDHDGRLTYMGQDGRRRIIVGDIELLTRTKEIQNERLENQCDGGCCI